LRKFENKLTKENKEKITQTKQRKKRSTTERRIFKLITITNSRNNLDVN
jgi:hypothetical protein